MAGIFGRTKQTIRRIQIIGGKKVRQNLHRIRKQANKTMVIALQSEAQSILKKAQKIVPYDTGNLSSTGIITPPRAISGRVSIEIKFGGRRAPYAVIQHENLEYHHDPPRQAKYLELPAKEAMAGMDDRIGQKIKTGIAIAPLTAPGTISL